MRTGWMIVACLFAAMPAAHALEPGSCKVIHGRATYYSADGQLRIWHIGTHHEFEPDSTSWKRVIAWMYAGVPARHREDSVELSAAMVRLYGNFLVCPTEPLHKGAVQPATIKSVTHRRYEPYE